MLLLPNLLTYCNDLLQADTFSDYAPNGLQVEGKANIGKLITGVTASQALIDAAIAAGGDALLVHHGFFWKGEPAVITGIKRRRIGALIGADMSLIAYHLPLDAHPQYGNNAQLAEVLGLTVEGRFGRNSRDELGMYGRLPQVMEASAVTGYLDQRLGRTPLHLAGGKSKIERVAWCTGGAQSYIEAAAALGVDAFISGEVSESTTHFCREAGIHYFAAGHHVTERYGVRALGEHLAGQFGITCEFIDIDNPV